MIFKLIFIIVLLHLPQKSLADELKEHKLREISLTKGVIAKEEIFQDEVTNIVKQMHMLRKNIEDQRGSIISTLDSDIVKLESFKKGPETSPSSNKVL